MDENGINLLENRFSTYSNNIIGPKEISDFIEQIKDFKTIDEKNLKILFKGFFNILKNVKYIDKIQMQCELKILLKKIENYINEPYKIIKYGKNEDSSYYLLQYLCDSVFKKNIVELNKALNDDSIETIVFLDDGMNSGHQMLSVFQEYMGVEKRKRATYERHVKTLSKANKRKFERKKIVIGYIFFNEKSENYIITELKKLGLKNVKVIFNYTFFPKLKDRNDIFDSQSEKEITMSFLQLIGLNLLQNSKRINKTTYKERWSKKRIRKSALGYNDAQQLIVYDYNIPTYTLPALWEAGVVNGVSWKGLFKRKDD